MKKFFLAACMGAAAVLTSCTATVKPGKSTFNSDVDTISYAMGMTRTQGLVDYLARQLGIEEEYLDDFVKGVYEGASKEEDPAFTAYTTGIQVGQQEFSEILRRISEQVLGDTGEELNRTNYINGFVAGVLSDYSVMDMSAADLYSDSLVNEVVQDRLDKNYGEYKARCEAFLAAKAKEQGVVATGTGLLYKVIKEGPKGAAKPEADSQVEVKYRGTNIEGEVFDESMDETVSFTVNQVIKGWTEALQLMPEGSVYELYVPYDLAYGERKMSDEILPYSCLVFEVELVKIKKTKGRPEVSIR